MHHQKAPAKGEDANALQGGRPFLDADDCNLELGRGRSVPSQFSALVVFLSFHDMAQPSDTRCPPMKTELVGTSRKPSVIIRRLARPQPDWGILAFCFLVRYMSMYGVHKGHHVPGSLSFSFCICQSLIFLVRSRSLALVPKVSRSFDSLSWLHNL